MLALTFRNKDGQPLSPSLLAAIAGVTQGSFGYVAELVEVPDQKSGVRMKPFLSMLAFTLFSFFAAVAVAQSSLPTDPGDIAAWFRETHSGGNWGLLIGGGITLLVRVLTLLKPLASKLPAESAKWIAMALAMLGSASTGLMSGVPWFKVIADGVQAGAVAIGGWELLLKPLLDKLAATKAT